MKFLALISGGKDSFFNIHHCLTQGHELVALGNLYPQNKQDEIDSFMFQTVGHDIIDHYAECLGVPLYRQPIVGGSKNQNLEYSKTQNDEIEDLFLLIQKVVKEHPEIEAISCGAILSHYQRTRVENICDRFGLTSLAFLWQRDQDQLMREMCESRLDARIIKVAAIGLEAKHLGKSISELYPYLVKLNQMYEVHICGEGGEFETMVFDSQFFKKRLEITESQIVLHSGDVSYLKFNVEVREKEPSEFKKAVVPSLLENDIEELFDFVNEDKKVYLEWGLKESNYEIESSISSIGNNLYISNLVDASETILEQLSNIFMKLEETLVDYNLTFNDIQHITLLLADMGKFADINEIYQAAFAKYYLPPSRVCIETTLPTQHQVQLSCKCIIKETNTKKGIHIRSRSYWAPQNIGPYSQARVEELRDLNFATISGQIPLIPLSMQLVNDEKTSIALTFQHFDRIRTIINVRGVSSIVAFVTGKINLDLLRQLWQEFCQIEDSSDDLLQKLVIAHVSTLPKNAIVEIGGESFKKIENLIEDDDDEAREESSILTQLKHDFPSCIITPLKSSVNVLIFTNNAEQAAGLLNLPNSFSKLYCTSENYVKLSSKKAEYLPVSSVMDYQLQEFNYSISLTIEV